MRLSPLYISVLLLLVVSCKQKEKPLTKEEVTEFGKQAEISVGKSDKDFLKNALDKEEFMSRMKLPKGLSKNDLRKALDDKFNIGELIINAIAPNGTYNIVRQYEKDGVHHLIFRLYKDGSLNYHDFEFIRSGGECKIADFYVYLTGEKISTTLTAVYAQLFRNYDKSSKMDADLKWITELGKMRSYLTAGKYEDAKKIMDQIPASVRQGKQFLIVGIEIASGLGNEEYTKAIRTYEELYPDDPNLPLLMIDGFFLSKEYKKGLAAIDKLDSSLGHDPFLDYHRSLFYKMMEDHSERVVCLERLMKAIPDFEDGHIELIAAYLDAEDYVKAKQEVASFRNHSAYNQEALNGILEMYPAYEQ